MLRTTLHVLAVALLPAIAQAQDRVIGLLSIPELFGVAPCERFDPKPVTLFAAPDSSTTAGMLRVDQYWTFHELGGCEGLTVNVHYPAADRAVPLATMEYEYEQPGVVVLAQSGRWLKVRVGEGATGWVHASEQDVFHSLDKLLTEGLTYLTESAGGQLVAAAGASEAVTGGEVAPGGPVRVLETRQHDGQQWVHVEVLSHSPCGSSEDPRVVARGWLPAHDRTGEPVVWFYSRGC